MKEKIIEILKSSLRTFAYIDPVTGESRSAQESAIPVDQFPKIAAEQLEPLINQEVEKRIKERMPKPKEAKEKRDNRSGDYLNPRSAMSFDSGFDYAYKWILSCLTCSEKPNNSEQQMWRDIQEGERELPE